MNVSNKIFVIGSDEVGRGPLAGPVVAASVCIEANSIKEIGQIFKFWRELGIADSKTLKQSKRLSILQKVVDMPVKNLQENKKFSIYGRNNFNISFSLSSKSPAYIDQVNILNASLEAMKNSGEILLEKKLRKNCLWFFDGNKLPKDLEKDIYSKAIVKGDSKMAIIGLASIIAKEYRDQMMVDYSKMYPQYGLEKHSGYPTKDHLEALRKFGPTIIHRKTFRGVL